MFLRLLIFLESDRLLHLASQADDAGQILRALGQGIGSRRPPASMLGCAVDVRNQRFQFLFELNIVVRAAQPALISEFEERDAAHLAGPLVEDCQFIGGLTDAECPRRGRRLLGILRSALGWLATRLVEIGPGMVLAEMEFADGSALQLRDVKHGLLVTLLALHEHTLKDATDTGLVSPGNYSGFQSAAAKSRFRGDILVGGAESGYSRGLVRVTQTPHSGGPIPAMPHLPDRQRFEQLATTHRLVPVFRRLFADAMTPLSAFARIDGGACGCLFESVVGGEKVGRYSFLGADPFMQIEARGRRVVVTRGATTETLECDDPLEELRSRMAPFQPARIPELPPFTSGCVGYAAYDSVRYTEYLPDAPPDDLGLPDLSFAFYDRLLVFDNATKSLDVVVLAHIDGEGPEAVEAAREEACRRIDATIEQLSGPSDWPPAADLGPRHEPRCLTDGSLRATSTREEYTAAVERAIEYIRAGDVFQVVLSRRLELPFDLPPLELYRTLRVVNPSPFMFFLRTPGATLVGSSPEIMVRVVDGDVTVRPLAGTRPRGKTAEEDRALAEGLLADPKERAEHVMLIDLGRNDVGRVSEIGSVVLSDVMSIERYSHVMHLTSNVCGRLAEGTTAFDALRACLPAGTVSGAPKIRAMEIIDELEPVRRGPYAGAVGYIDFGGSMDTCIALRTVVLTGGKAYVQSGAGIVADSLPASEFEETLNKARGLLVSIEMTVDRLRRDGPLSA